MQTNDTLLMLLLSKYYLFEITDHHRPHVYVSKDKGVGIIQCSVAQRNCRTQHKVHHLSL